MVSENISNKFDSDCVNFSSMQRFEEMFDDPSDRAVCWIWLSFREMGVGYGFDHTIIRRFDDCCFLVLNYSSHVISRVVLVIKHFFTPIDQL